MIRKGIISGACLNLVITSHYITLLNIIIYYVTLFPTANLKYMPDALNMSFVKNRSVQNYNNRNKDKLRPAIAKHLYRDRDFRLVGVHVWNYICDNINIDTPFASFKRILKIFILSEKLMFYLI